MLRHLSRQESHCWEKVGSYSCSCFCTSSSHYHLIGITCHEDDFSLLEKDGNPKVPAQGCRPGDEEFPNPICSKDPLWYLCVVRYYRTTTAPPWLTSEAFCIR